MNIKKQVTIKPKKENKKRQKTNISIFRRKGRRATNIK